MSDLERGIPMQLTRQPLPDVGPIWAADGRSIAYSAAGPRRMFEIMIKPPTIDAEPSMLFGKPVVGFPMHYSDDGRYLLYRTRAPDGRWDIWALATFENRDPIPVATSPDYDERVAQFSPDSRFIAYRVEHDGADGNLCAALPSRSAWQAGAGDVGRRLPAALAPRREGGSRTFLRRARQLPDERGDQGLAGRRRCLNRPAETALRRANHEYPCKAERPSITTCRRTGRNSSSTRSSNIHLLQSR